MFVSVFKNCFNIKKIPNDLLKNMPLISNVDSLFSGCEKLEEIPHDIFLNNTNIYVFDNTFYKTGIKSIPSNLFSNMRRYYESSPFDKTFSNCQNLITIPPGLFDNPIITLLRSTFENSHNISSIPEKFIRGNIKTINRIFYGCNSITSIPDDFFQNKIINFNETFYGTNIKTLKSILFNNRTNVNLTAGFKGLHLLSIIEEHIFDSLTTNSATSIFEDCTSLEIIPDNLFPQTISIVSSAFKNTKIKTFPSNLFNINTYAFNNTFENCTSLTQIPQITTHHDTYEFNNMFKNCTSLKIVPNPIFNNLDKPGYHAIKQFQYTFYNCNIQTTVEELWNEFPNAQGEFCFYGNNNIPNYDDIPQDWINDGTPTTTTSSSSSSSSSSSTTD
jgi:hypothetical protein